MVITLRIRSLLIPLIISISTFVILMFLSFNFNIKPGAYSFVEDGKILTLSKGVTNTQSFEIHTDNSLKTVLITNEIKKIDISWIVCILMFSYLIFIISLMKYKSINMKKYWLSILIVALFIVANLIRIAQSISDLSDILK